MEFENFLKENAQSIEIELDKILSGFLKQTKKTNPKLLPFAQKFVNSCKGGKRIRGVLVKLGYEMTRSVILSPSVTLSGREVQWTSRAKGIYSSHPQPSATDDQNDKSSSQNDIVKIGAGFEILHTALLIHDDIIDKSPTRRGQPSLYASLGNNHYGISQAITLGDIGLYLPIKIITETQFSDEVKVEALNYFSQILINTGWGQIMDVEKTESTSEESKPTSEVTKFINLFKTAKYTIAGPLQIGAILGGADEKLIRDFGVFGENLGIAFQIQDDILDLEVKDMEKARSKALEYAFIAKGMISKITKNQKMEKLLEDMCNYLVERSR